MDDETKDDLVTDCAETLNLLGKNSDYDYPYVPKWLSKLNKEELWTFSTFLDSVWATVRPKE